MKHWLKVALATLLITPLLTVADTLQINGVAAYEHLRREIYVGGLYLAKPAHDPAAIAAQAGGKRMVLRITAERWSPMQFAQHWNQMILINNGGSTLNANVMDVLSFTSIPKGDLVKGDELVIELTGSGTVTTLNGVTVVKTANANLFNMLVNTWIGARPPSTEFKRDILNLPRDKAGADLLARFDTIKPADARRKQVAAWGLKETETQTAAAATTATAAATAAAVAKPKTEAPTTAAATAAAPEPKKPAAAPAPEKAAVAATVAAAVTAPPTPPAVDVEAQKARRARQQALYEQYSGTLRSIVTRNIRYPKGAIKRNQEGLVVVKLAVARDGKVLSSDVAQSADSLLDKAALKAIDKSGNMPPMNAEMEGTSFDFLIPVVFKLTEN